MTVYIEVERSTRAPRFENTPYPEQRIAETKKIGESIFTVSAHDPDLKVGMHSNVVEIIM